MIKLWLSQKLRLLSRIGSFVAGLACIVLPWYLALFFLLGALVLDYFSFKLFMQSL